jgi:hypothetical protein
VRAQALDEKEVDALRGGPVGYARDRQPQEGGGTVGKNNPQDKAAREQALSNSQASRDEQAKRFVANLSEEEIMLVRLRDELYEGRWDTMLADLNDRLQGKPYIFKLAHRIQDDLKRIERLHRFERTRGVNLADYL